MAMGIRLFGARCECGGTILGPRVGNRLQGEWLGHERCSRCKTKEKAKAKEAGLTRP